MKERERGKREWERRARERPQMNKDRTESTNVWPQKKVCVDSEGK